MMRREPDIQALRAVAALLVVTDHALECLDGTVPGSGAINGWFVRDQFGACGVDLFFVISGYVMAIIAAGGPRPAAFLRARFVRVTPLAWGAGLLFGALSWAQGQAPTLAAIVNTATIFPAFDPGPYRGTLPAVGWTLGFEMWFYLLIAGLLRLVGRCAIPAGIALLIALATVGALQPGSRPLWQVATSPLLAEFAFGMAIGLVRPAGRGRLALLGLGLWLVGTWLGFTFRVEPAAMLAGHGVVRRLLLWGVPSALIVAGLAGPQRRLPRALVALGDASYALYLVHTLPNILLPDGWSRRDALGADWLFMTLMTTSVLLGLAAHRWIERPLLARLRRGDQASVAASASTVSPRSLTSANPPSTWMRAATVLAPE